MHPVIFRQVWVAEYRQLLVNLDVFEKLVLRERVPDILTPISSSSLSCLSLPNKNTEDYCALRNLDIHSSAKIINPFIIYYIFSGHTLSSKASQREKIFT